MYYKGRQKVRHLLQMHKCITRVIAVQRYRDEWHSVQCDLTTRHTGLSWEQVGRYMTAVPLMSIVALVRMTSGTLIEADNRAQWHRKLAVRSCVMKHFRYGLSVIS